MRKIYRTLLILILCLATVAVFSPEPAPAHAAFITVDLGTQAIADDGFCALTEAIILANNDTDANTQFGHVSAGECGAGAGADVITLNANVTLTAEETTYSTNVGGGYAGLPDITSAITIRAGTGSVIERAFTTCDRTDADPDFRILNVVNGGDVSLEGLTLRNGCVAPVSSIAALGGAIYVLNATISAITNSTLAYNTARGGDAAPLGPVSGNGYGGAIYALNATIGAITNSTLAYNTARGGDDATFFTGWGAGAGIYVEDSTIGAITNSTLAYNTARGGDAGRGEGGTGFGGGIFCDASSVIGAITNSTLAYNTARGGDADVVNGRGGFAWAGGILSAGATVTLNNVTVAGNRATGGSGALVDGYGDGGGVYGRNAAIVNVFSAILADNTISRGAGTPVANDCEVTVGAQASFVISSDYNLVEAPGNCTFGGANDQTGVDPGLQPLADNGCATMLPDGTCVETMAITDTSAALDTGSCGLSGITDDERGGTVSRPQDWASVTNADDGCDIGAFELSAPLDLEVIKNDSPDPVEAGSGSGNLAHVVTVNNLSADSRATGVVVTDVFTLPAGVSIDSVTASQGTVDSSSAPTYVWTVGDLGVSGSATLTIVLTVDDTASAGMDVISDTATITALDQNDTNPANDADTEATSIITSGTPIGATPVPGDSGTLTDPALSKIGVLQPGGLGLPGEVITWTITAFGPFTNGVITDTFPPEVRVDQVTTTQGTSSINGQTVTVLIGNLSAGQTATITVTTTILSNPSAPTIDNTAYLTHDGGTLSAPASVLVISSLPSTGYGR